MVLEIADIRVRPGSEADFLAAFRGVREVLDTAEGCRSVRMTQGIESPDRFVLLVEWDSVEAHEQNFRATDRFGTWRGAISPFFAGPPHVEHVADVCSRRLLRCDRLDQVAVRVPHDRVELPAAKDRPAPGRVVAGAAGGERRGVEGLDLRRRPARKARCTPRVGAPPPVTQSTAVSRCRTRPPRARLVLLLVPQLVQAGQAQRGEGRVVEAQARRRGRRRSGSRGRAPTHDDGRVPTAEQALQLTDWRRRVARLYAEVRAADEPASGHRLWRAGRDALFRDHPQSPLTADDPLRGSGLPYWPYDPALRLTAALLPADPAHLDIPTATDGTIGLDRIGRVEVLDQSLDVWWLAQYGGGLFVPLRDATAGTDSYGGGRYLLDTAKGADLGARVRRAGARPELRLPPVLPLQPAVGMPARARGQPARHAGPGRGTAGVGSLSCTGVRDQPG